MEIKRDDYLNRLIRRKHNGMVKVVTGIRRCGKSYLLFNLFQKHLLECGVKEDHIIKVVLDDRRNIALRDPDMILKYVLERISDSEPHYVILDEVQFLPEFEDVLATFLHLPNADVYVTGSNSKFLSSDVITEFRGRGDEVRVHPLSFREFSSVFPGSVEKAWDTYFLFGGLPQTALLETDEQKIGFLQSVFQRGYISDIVERHRISHPAELDELIDVLASSVGSLTSPLKLAKTFQSVKKRNITDKTLKRYLDSLTDAFLISKASRYDLKGRRYIASPAKYYFEDVGLRNARLGFRQTEENHIMENIIYNELRIRGYQVDVGVVEQFGKDDRNKSIRRQLEIDFVAARGSEKYYIQSAFEMPTREKSEQEQRPLRAVPDSFKKIVIVKNDIRVRRNEDGIVTMGVLRFLSDENSLNV